MAKTKHSLLKGHLVPCPQCGKDVLDHMTECPFCHASIKPTAYSPMDPAQIKKIRRTLTIIGMIIALLVFLATR